MVCCTVRVAQGPVFQCNCRVNPTSCFDRNGSDICVCRFNRHVGWLLSGNPTHSSSPHVHCACRDPRWRMGSDHGPLTRARPSAPTEAQDQLCCLSTPIIIAWSGGAGHSLFRDWPEGVFEGVSRVTRFNVGNAEIPTCAIPASPLQEPP